MSFACAKSWGSMQDGWTFCTRPKGHEGNCHNCVDGDKPAEIKFFEEQPDAVLFCSKQLETERLSTARKSMIHLKQSKYEE